VVYGAGGRGGAFPGLIDELSGGAAMCGDVGRDR
jgi:hypothetical protein